ncbi:TPA: hypothetical protein JIZ13_06135 [Acinetobacter nosocomialis]|uniref:Uncharacterized protein n=1 Tax=Acinetobacter nosocomialis TaxID=106654 RepID=A0A2L1VFL5_ACINO|nr:hypothetical protein B7L44_09415 [Acinetobacter nosocomialis]MPS60863.1 hypothetical protein [Acinetobacter sp.]QCP65841.1 hypothetical protein FDQ49_17090 [Acinetobacter nosocomialis M2]AVF44020.1 hypothetical protein AL533_06300 [Acinetobacter nosocomialis]AWL18985.1 hypothetical protein DIW83_08115 [Acinetobacter nosocomialis]
MGEVIVSENTEEEKVLILKNNKINFDLFISLEAQMKLSKSMYYNIKFNSRLKNNIFKIYAFLNF